MDAIGKLHFRSAKDDNGFGNEIETMHVVEGLGDVLGCLRNDTNNFNKRKGVLDAGPGDSSYLQYDARIAEHTCNWIEEHKTDENPWALFVGFVLPHPPTIAPPDLFEYYYKQDLPMPPQWKSDEWPKHKAMDFLREFFQFQEPMDEKIIHRFLAAYYGTCTYVDQQVGKILEALEKEGVADSTRIIFVSDHGEAQGARGVFGKFNMYEESSAIPMLMCGPDIPNGKVVDTPVSLIDCYKTVLESLNMELDSEEEKLPGCSLWSLFDNPSEDRTVFSEYHAVGSKNAMYMLRNLQYKYIYHVGNRPQLFDIKSDPEEKVDLAEDSSYEPTLNFFKKELRKLLDPEAVDRKAKEDQKAKIESAGGESRVRQMGTFDNTPIPGEAPKFFKSASEIQ